MNQPSAQLPKIVDDYFNEYRKNIIGDHQLLDQLINCFTSRPSNILDNELDFEEINLGLECAQYIGLGRSLDMGLIKPKSKTRVLYELFRLLVNQPVKLEENSNCVFPCGNLRSEMPWHIVINNILGNNIEIHQLRSNFYGKHFLVDILYNLEIINMHITRNNRWGRGGTVDIKFTVKFISKISLENEYTDKEVHKLNQLRGSEFHTIVLNLDSDFMFLLNLE